MFQKSNQHRVFQDLVNQIEGAILDGRLKVGDKLPPQRELVEMFQTSRASLREALRVLEQKGLIDIKLGVSGGAVIKAVDTAPVTESLALLIQHQKVSLEELAEFREGVEGNVAALAARRATRAEIANLKALLETARECVRQGIDAWEKLCEVDNAIHVAIAAASGNSVYGFVLRMVHGNIQRYYEAHPLKDARILQENYDDLCEIVRALEKKQVTVVKSLVQGHVRRFNRYMLNNEC
ncbi:MAG: FadR family transcriptional regulator [Desulfobacterales bacterium]|nr:FadR family transcriptional regulator [Desulfobacterales bacterium]